jgi:ribosomal protein S18 acetylase RimI-like enzyme
MGGDGIRLAQRCDVDALVDIYIACFPERVREVFGGPQRRTMIRDYLLFYLSWDPGNNWVAIGREGVVGFIIAPCRYSPLKAAVRHGQVWRWLWHLLSGQYGLPLHILRLFLVSGFAFSPNAVLQRMKGKPTIHLCAVRPRHQGRGVASGLVAHTMAAYRRNGVSGCWLAVQQDNIPAIALYKKFGFDLYAAVSEHEIVMVQGALN